MKFRPIRRALLALGAAGAGAAVLETLSLRGHFDNRKRLPPTALDRYRASLDEVARGGEAEASIVHIGHSTHLLCLGGLRVLTDPCPYCSGTGVSRSTSTICYEILSEVKKISPELNGHRLLLRVNPDIARALREEEREVLRDLRESIGKDISIRRIESPTASAFR